ncbi:hypothetical protein [Sorangium sp. So ce854]|uniref:hypothetical protein n=1 Tax=Sorangium sp. So ce854 TaxID=3133322 RepID=UPI003F6241A0
MSGAAVFWRQKQPPKKGMDTTMWQRFVILIVTSSSMLSVPACGSPCKPIPDPDCDWHSPENHCAYLCTEDELTDDSDETDGDASDRSEIVDHQPARQDQGYTNEASAS